MSLVFSPGNNRLFAKRWSEIPSVPFQVRIAILENEINIFFKTLHDRNKREFICLEGRGGGTGRLCVGRLIIIRASPK